MKKQIFIDKSEKSRICKDFNVSNVTLWGALTFKTESSKAKMLRKVALERGGQVVGDNPKPISGCKTVFNTAGHIMTQVFSDRVSLAVDLSTGNIAVFVDGDTRIKSDGMTIPEFMKLQQDVQLIATELK